jgi:dTDP-glucose 4,6-dehydratase
MLFCALRTQVSSVSASFRHGKTTDSSQPCSCTRRSVVAAAELSQSAPVPPVVLCGSANAAGRTLAGANGERSPLAGQLGLALVRGRGRKSGILPGRCADSSEGRSSRTMRVFVTGGAGFIGSQYVRELMMDAYPAFAGAEVTVFDKLTYAGNLANLAPVADSARYRFVRGDICSASDLDAALPGHDVLINFAAESHVDRSIIGAADFIQTNVLGAQQVFEAALRHDVQRVVHVSTDEVYGSIPVGAWTEDHVLEPNSPYSAAKAGGDLLARAYAKTYGLNISVTRCSNNYGPYHFPEKVIPLFVTNLLDGKKVPLYGEGLNVRDWLFVSDHCRGVQLVVEQGRPGEFYNIGGGQELSNKELTQLLLDATGRSWDFVQHIVDPRGGGHDLRYALDYSKIAELGYEPRMSFDDGLAFTVDWYRTHRDWWEPLKARAAMAKDRLVD